ncbi:NAD(P)-binding protein [Hypomontagnella submonticulosa]|nr:NAD(P)-binding protein [Hypomontagnella submonticulosa]
MFVTNDLSFHGKVAIVTGSGRPNGIGAAIAEALAVRGACVTINYVSDSSALRAADLAESIRTNGGKATVVRGDVGDPEVARKLVRETLAAFNTDKIDILGRFPPSPQSKTRVMIATAQV